MVKNIYLTRYSKILLPLIGLILLMFAFNAWSNVKNWHDNERYLTTDKELKADFNAYPEHYTYLDEKKQEHIPYASFEKYIEHQLYVYHKNDFSDKISQKTDPNQTYFNQSSNVATVFALFLASFVGFCLFFVDLKTHFTRFLFSLPVSRKELFAKKLLYLALPFLATIFVGQLLYLAILRLGIPQPYLNASLGDMFSSVVNSFSLIMVVFCLSVFVGVMVGNLVFGPLTWFVFLIFLCQIPSAVGGLLSMIRMLHAHFLRDFDFNTLFIFEIGKTTGHWYMSLLFLLISISFIYWEYRKFQVISLEHESEYLLTPESRWQIWFFMTVLTSFVLVFAIKNPWSYYLSGLQYNFEVSFMTTMMTTLTIIVICGGICFVVVFFSSIKRFFRSLKARRLAR